MAISFQYGDCHASVLCSVLRAAFGGCTLHAPAGAVVRNDSRNLDFRNHGQDHGIALGGLVQVSA